MVKKNRDMPQRILQLSLLLIIFFISSVKDAFAETFDPEQIKALIEETRALRAEVSELKKQLASHTGKHKNQPVQKPKPLSLKKPMPSKAKQVAAKKSKPAKQASAAQVSTDGKTQQSKNRNTLGGYLPIIAPYLNQTPAYDGSDLLTNLSEQNADLLALQFRQEIENAFSQQKFSQYYLILSGTLSAQLFNINTYTRESNSDVDLTVANITALTGIGKWVTGLFSFDYDNTSLNGLNPPQYGPRNGNSRIFLDEGFLTLGNLHSSDWYASAGQMYLPFGQYNSYMINSPVTASLFTISERPVLLGYSHSTATTEIDASIYAYQGETLIRSNSSVINEWGASLDYIINQANWNGQIGISYVSNIADAEGIQLNSQYPQICQIFGGFAFPCGRGSNLAHRVPGFDVYGLWTYGRYSLLSEYITAVRAFAPGDMTFNRQGAKPQAFDLEGAYAFSFFDKPSSISLGYSFTKEALALLLPAQQYSLTVTTSFWRKTTQSLGFQHSINYSSRSTATGQGLPIYLPEDRINLGKTSNTVILALSAYF